MESSLLSSIAARAEYLSYLSKYQAWVRPAGRCESPLHAPEWLRADPGVPHLGVRA